MATSEIIIKGRDESSAAVASAVAGLRRLGNETKSVGSALSQAGNIASAFGNETIAGLTNRAGMLTTAFKSLSEVASKVGLARAGVAGVVIALGSWVAQRAIAERQKIAEKVEQEAKEFKKLEENITATAKAQQNLNQRIAEGARGKGISELKKMIEDLSLAQQGRKMGAVIGDPITPLGRNPVKEAMDLKPIDLKKQMEDAQEMVRKHHEEKWEMEEELYELRKQREKELAEERTAQEEKAFEIYEAIQENKLEIERKMDAELKEQVNREADEAEKAWEQQQKQWEKENAGLVKMQETREELFKNSLGNMKQAALSFSADAALAISSGIGNSVAAIATGAMEAKEAFKQLGKELLGMLVKWAAQLVVNTVLAQALEASMLVTSAAIGAGVASAWAPAAAMVSLASYGANAIPATAGIISTTGMAKTLAVVGQFHSGTDYVRQEGSYNLERGEIVLDPGTSDAVRNAAIGGGGRPTQVSVYIDGEKLFDAIGRASRNGRLEISARAVA